MKIHFVSNWTGSTLGIWAFTLFAVWRFKALYGLPAEVGITICDIGLRVTFA